MNEIYKVVTKAEDYPNYARVVPLEKGDGFYLVGSRDVKVGDKYTCEQSSEGNVSMQDANSCLH